MSNDTNNMNTDKKSISYGAKLKAAREAIGLEQKDIAAQLRLGERIIEMLESGHYANDVPTTFIRGYVRSYSKLLQIPESEIAAALEPIQPIPTQTDAVITKQPTDVTSANYYMQFSTYAIVATLAGMLGLWWYNHTPSSHIAIASSQTVAIAELPKSQENKAVTADTTSASSTSSANTTVGTNASGNASISSTTGPTIAAATPAATKPAVATKRIVRDEDDDDDDEDDGHHH